MISVARRRRPVPSRPGWRLSDPAFASIRCSFAAAPPVVPPEVADMTDRIVVTTFEDVKEAFRQRALQQALYDDGADLMRHVIVNLHANEHRVRRRVENRLFRRDVFRLYEHELIPQAI